MLKFLDKGKIGNKCSIVIDQLSNFILLHGRPNTILLFSVDRKSNIEISVESHKQQSKYFSELL